MGYTITSNYKPRAVVAWEDLPPSARKEIPEPPFTEEPRYFRAYGEWYDSHEFMSISNGISVAFPAEKESHSSALEEWDGIMSLSAWSALVCRYDDRSGELVVGLASW